MKHDYAWSLACFAVLLITGPIHGWAQTTPAGGVPLPVIVSKFATSSPVIDGNLNDECWKNAEQTRPLTVLGHFDPQITGQWLEAEKKFVTHAATAQICHDSTNLYIAFRAPAPEDTPARTAATNDDGNAWQGDCIELFLDPMRQLGFYQIAVNAVGTLADGKALPGGASLDNNWKSGVLAKTTRDGAGFIVEMALPFSALGKFPHSAGTVWGVNFTREGKSGGGLSTWAPVGDAFANPDRFGLLIFESRKAFHEAEWRKAAGSLAAMPTNGNAALPESARKKADALKARIASAEDSLAAWAPLCEAQDELNSLVLQMAMAGRASLLWRKDIWGALAPNEMPDSTRAELKELNLLAGRNTRAATGFLISNISGKPLLGRLIFKPKNAPERTGALLDEKRIWLRRSLFLELVGGSMIPDALLDLPPFNLVEVSPRSTQLIWVEFDTAGLAPGRYCRDVEFVPEYSGFEKSAFTITLDVAPVDLAAPRIPQFMYGSASQPFIARNMARHGVTIAYCGPQTGTNVPTFDAEGALLSVNHAGMDRAIKLMETAGVARSNLTVLFYLAWCKGCSGYYEFACPGKASLKFGTPPWQKALGNWLRSFRDRLFAQGFKYDQIVFYTADEPSGDPADIKSGAYLAVQGAAFIKQVDPRLRTMCNPNSDSKNARWLDAYFKVYDILEPYIGHLEINPEAVRKYQTSGREIWTYGICGKTTPPASYRNMSWQMASYGFSGACAAWLTAAAGDPFNAYDATDSKGLDTTDYAVVYYGTGERTIDSRRWEALYQGNQDYRAIAICRDRIARLKAAGKESEAAQFNQRLNQAIKKTVNQSGGVMDAAREQLLRLAVEIESR